MNNSANKCRLETHHCSIIDCDDQIDMPSAFPFVLQLPAAPSLLHVNEYPFCTLHKAFLI